MAGADADNGHAVGLSADLLADSSSLDGLRDPADARGGAEALAG